MKFRPVYYMISGWPSLEKTMDLIPILLYRFVCCNASEIRPFRAGSSTFGKILKNHAGLLTSSTNCVKV